MKIAYVLYPDFTALDLVGLHEVNATPSPRRLRRIRRALSERRATTRRAAGLVHK